MLPLTHSASFVILDPAHATDRQMLQMQMPTMSFNASADEYVN